MPAVYVRLLVSGEYYLGLLLAKTICLARLTTVWTWELVFCLNVTLMLFSPACGQVVSADQAPSGNKPVDYF